MISVGANRICCHLMQTVYTSGELGSLINLESQTRKTYGFLTKYDKAIEAAYGKKLPAETELSKTYSQSPRLVVLNERAVIGKGEKYKMEVIVLGSEQIAEAPVLMYRELGKGKFKELEERSGNYSKEFPHQEESKFLQSIYDQFFPIF